MLAVQTLVSQLGFGMFYVVWQPYLLSTGIGVVQLGIIQSLINISTGAGLLTWGALSDRLGRKPVILVSNLCRTLAIVALLVSGDLVFLLLFAFFIGFSSLFMQGNPARSALLAESVTAERRATAMSTLMAIRQIVSTLVASAGGYIAVEVGYYPIFYICIAGDVIGLVAMTLYLEETHRGGVDEGSGESLLARARMLLVPERENLLLYLILMVMGFSYMTAYSLFYGTLVDSFGYTTIQLGLISTAFNATWGLAAIPLGRVSDRIGRKRSLMASWCMALVTVLGFLFFRRFEGFLFFNAVSAIDIAFWLPAWTSLVAERVPPGELSTVYGKLDAYSRIAGIPAPWLAGLLYSRYGYGAPLLAQVFGLVFSGLLILRIRDTGRVIEP